GALRRRPHTRQHPPSGSPPGAGALRSSRMSTSYRVAVRQLLRDRLLDAGHEQLAEGTWAQVTMAEIAAAAGVSRQTLYNEFGSRDEFGQALVIREGGRFLDEVEQAIGQHAEDPRAALTAA